MGACIGLGKFFIEIASFCPNPIKTEKSVHKAILSDIIQIIMPMIKIQYDDAKVKKSDALSLSDAIQKIVSEVTEIEDVFVYANSAEIKVKVAPIEIFIEMSAHKIKDEDALIKNIKERLLAWKKENNFSYPINLSLIPMHWKIETGI